MFLKNPKIRRFEYKPRFYKPESEEEQDHPRIKFRRIIERKPVQRRSFVGMFIILVILVFILFSIQKAFKSENQNQGPIEEIKIEVIE